MWPAQSFQASGRRDGPLGPRHDGHVSAFTKSSMVQLMGQLFDKIRSAAQVLADGTTVKAVWAHIASLDLAKLVTVHFFDR